MKYNEISKDEHHTYSDEVQKLTDEFIGKVEARRNCEVKRK